MPFVSLPLNLGVPWPVLFASEPPRRDPPKSRGDASRDHSGGVADRQLLLVEDNPADVELVREALGGLPFRVSVSTATHGEDAVALLRDAATRGVLPDVIFLDLNLPRMHGLEVLAQLKMDPGLRHIPVVVLTSSSAPKDSGRSTALRADEFVTKPLDVDDFFAAVRSSARRWLPE